MKDHTGVSSRAKWRICCNLYRASIRRPFASLWATQRGFGVARPVVMSSRAKRRICWWTF